MKTATVSNQPERGPDAHFAFLRERHRIWLRRRAGQPAPCTEDPILGEWRFTSGLVHTSEKCNSESKCPVCNDPEAQMVPTYPSFVALVEAFVLPRMNSRPGQNRIDGRTKGGGKHDWAPVARFWFDGRVWEVHGDSHFDPLMLAYWSARFRRDGQTFKRVELPTRVKLVLADDLQAVRGPGPKNMSLYLTGPGSRRKAHGQPREALLRVA